MLSSEAMPPTLMTIPLDLQIRICTFLHPSDILALRETCKDIRSTTKQRTIWIDALRRICLANGLFLPSFPIPEMSDVELEQAALGPCRWINLCTTLQKQQSNGATPYDPIKTRTIDNLSPWLALHDQVLLVPGGRYLVTCSGRRLEVWDLGYIPNADCVLLSIVVLETEPSFTRVNATSDGMGLIIVIFCIYQDCSVYEMYPQSENPQLTQIAHLRFDPSRNDQAYLMPDRVVWYGFYMDRIVIRVWDYRLNHSVSFFANIEVDESNQNIEVITTNTEIIAICEDEILVWSIPPLSSHPPDFSDHNLAYIPELFRVAFPDDFECQTSSYLARVVSSQYYGPSQPLYFDATCRDRKCHGLEIVIKSDLSDVSLRVTNASRLTHYDFNDFFFREYTICEGSLICWDISNQNICRVHIRPTTSPPANVTSSDPTISDALLSVIGSPHGPSLCPASGRLAYMDKSNPDNIFVIDFL